MSSSPKKKKNDTIDPTELSIAELVQQRAAADSANQANNKITRSAAVRAAIKSRTFAKPMKPLFEGKSIEEALPRRNSDTSINSSALRSIVDDDDNDDDVVSLGSVQNLETVPSIAESPGIFNLISSNFRKRRTSADNKQQHIGELPNRHQLQTKVIEKPIVMAEIQQSSGVYTHAASSSSAENTEHTKSSASNHSLSVGFKSPNRKDSLNLFRGADLQNIISQADSNHRRMMELEDHDDDGGFGGDNDSQPDPFFASPRHSTGSILLETSSDDDEDGTKKVDKNNNKDTIDEDDSSARKAPRRVKRSTSASSTNKDAELAKAKERIRNSNRQQSSSYRRSGGKLTDEKTKSTPNRARSTSGEESEKPTNPQSSMDDSFAWTPIVSQSNDFLSASSTKIDMLDIDSQRGYSSDSSEYQHKSRARWYMSEEGRQVQDRLRRQQELLVETLGSTAIHVDSGKGNFRAITKKSEKEAKRLENEWHDASGGITSKSNTEPGQVYEASPAKSLENKKDLFRGKSLDEALPDNEKVEGSEKNEGFDFYNSMPSLATMTVATDDGSLFSDAFSKQYIGNQSKSTSIEQDEIDSSPIARKEYDPHRSILRNQARNIEALNLEESNHGTATTSPIRPYEWQKIKISNQDGLEKDDKVYEQSPSKSSRKTSESRLTGTLEKNAKDLLIQSQHSEASSMGETFLINDKSTMEEDAIYHQLKKKVVPSEAPNNLAGAEETLIECVGGPAAMKNAKKTAKKATQAIEKAFMTGKLDEKRCKQKSARWFFRLATGCSA